MSNGNPTAPGDHKDADKHKTSHVYSDGNIQFDVRGTLFKVHKSVLAKYSETFSDMFGLPHVQPAKDNHDEPISLDDLPEAFDSLMSAVYDGAEFLYHAPLTNQLRAMELAQKYQMCKLEANIQAYITSCLPASAEDVVCSPNTFQHYQEDAQLARLVLRCGINELRPWAFYSMGVRILSGINVQVKSTYESPPSYRTLDGTFTYSLLILQQLIQNLLARWDKKVGDFYSTGCPESVGTRVAHASCSRSSRKFDHGSPLFISPEGRPATIAELMGQKIQKLAEAMGNERDTDHGRWCNKCKSTLKQIASDVLLDMYPYLVECATQVDRSRL